MSENHRKARMGYLARRKKELGESEVARIEALGPWPTLRMVNPKIRRPRQRYVSCDNGYVLVEESPKGT